ncbi:hypothetical protein DRP53_07615 [candidate division WOR-3 bacterium]|uniref:FlgD/Vpr Ig-like domain-containing protein n=1 Tax=candidate division WOR-3 bacterium TaxID=2052148 RepID=A0A660SI32_UNCW3|nr:MAG: hypothetical protein DRP53_07615 [candidate division WOR-3 bacterium]
MRAIRATCLIWAILIVDSLFAQAPDTLWTRLYGDFHGQDEGRCVRETGDGYITAGTKGVSGSYRDLWILKTDHDGNLLWEKTFGSSGDSDRGNSIALTSDGCYVIAGTVASEGDAYTEAILAKFDKSGNMIWKKTYSLDDYTKAHYVQETTDKGFVLIGTVWDWETSDPDIFILKTDADGNALAHKIIGTPDIYERGYSGQQTSDGGYIISGLKVESSSSYLYLIKLDSSLNITWEKTYSGCEGKGIKQLADEGFIIASHKVVANDVEAWLIRTDKNGNIVKDITFGVPYDNDLLNSVDITNDGGFVAAGYTHHSLPPQRRMFILKTDIDLNTQWEKYIECAHWAEANSIEETSEGNFIIVGKGYNNSQNGCDLFLVKLGGSPGLSEKVRHPSPLSLDIFPNPCNRRVKIHYKVRNPCELRVRILNASGQVVKDISHGYAAPGDYTLFWDGNDFSGRPLPSGIYFCQIEASGSRLTERIVVMR